MPPPERIELRARYLRVTAAALLGCAGAMAHAADRPGTPGQAKPIGAGVKVPPHERFVLANGVRVILLARHDVPLIAFDAVVRGGARMDDDTRAGTASLAAELLSHGAGDRDAYAFADAVEGAGGSLDAEARSEAIIVHGQFLARDRELMLTLLADALLRPHFEAAEFDKLRERRIEFIKAAKDSEPQSLIGSYGRALLFGDHPFSKPLSGSESGLTALTREDVLSFYQHQFGADRLTLVVAGDFEPAVMKSSITKAFSSWRHAAASLAVLPAPARVQGRHVLLIDSPGSVQTYFWIANVGVSRAYTARAALDVTDTAFGGSFGSMLMQALRRKTGLTYSANSGFRRGSVAGEFSINSFTQTSTTERALQIALQTLAELHATGLEPAVIDSARNYILGQYPLHFETAADWAATLADLDLYGLDDSYINDYDPQLARVDAASARRVIADAFPTPDNVDIVLIGDAARIRDVAAKFGPVVEKPLAALDFKPPGSSWAAVHEVLPL